MNASQQMPEPSRAGLPWQFWLWQCVPMAFLILLMPPGEDAKWWIHKPLMDWIALQSWYGLLQCLGLTTWFCQGILLAYWMVWGSGYWGHRFFKVLGLSVLAVLVPAIWFVRHFQLFGTGLNPWSEVLNPLQLSLFFLWAVGCWFLPAVIVVGAMYGMGYRMKQVELPPSSLKRWQFSLWGLSVLTFVCSVVLAFFGWIYPALVGLVTLLQPVSKTQTEWDMVIGSAASSAITALLAGVILIRRKWQITATVFGFLMAFYALGVVSMSQDSTGGVPFRWTGPLFLSVDLALGNMISLAITRYWIGRGRFILVRMSPEPFANPNGL